MKKDILTFILAHSDIADAMAQGVQKILGPQDNLFTFSNKNESLPVLSEKIQILIDANKNKSVICFSDLKGGSCWTLSKMVQKRNKKMIIISGINLPMLVTYFNNQSSMDLSELIDKTIHDGCRGIQSENLDL
jgi:mannose/fructose-specific phosphotransferase system component IIA